MKNINLSHFVPFELYINPETNLIEQADALELKYNTRKLFDMKEVIYDKKWLEKQENNFDLYYMYRNLIREQDKELFEQHNIRFDITIIPPKKLGKELVKTAGHFHPKIEGEMSYPEVYEVMHGEGLYLLQKEELTNTGEIELIIIAAHAGDQILIPPGYGHITINPSKDQILVMNNLVSSEFSSIYEPIKEHQGAAYLCLEGKDWIKNPEYEPNLAVQEFEVQPISKKPFYLSFLDEPDKWSFLNKPWERKHWLKEE